MVTVNPVMSSSIVALRVMQADRASEPGSGQEAAPSAASPLDPRNASLVSSRAAAAISELVRGGQGTRRAEPVAENDAGIRQGPTEQQFAKAMKETPLEDVERLKSFGATKWVRHEYPHLDDASFIKKVKDLQTEAFEAGDRDSAEYAGFKKAFLDGNITIKRISEVPEASGMLARSYDLYYDNGGVGSTSWGSKTAGDYMIDYKKHHPDMNVTSGGINDDGYLIYWSKPSAPASAA